MAITVNTVGLGSLGWCGVEYEEGWGGVWWSVRRVWGHMHQAYLSSPTTISKDGWSH